MRSIKKEVVTSTILAEKIQYINGVLTAVEQEPIVVVGEKVLSDKAFKLAHKKFGNREPMIVKSITYTVSVYRMSADDFLKNATLEETKAVSEEEIAGVAEDSELID